MHVQPILGEPTLLLAFEGWNDACESASAAVCFVNEILRGVPLADIDPDDYYDFTVLRPSVQYQAGSSGPIVWPSNDFRYGVTEEGLELITGLGIEPHMRWRSYCNAVVELAVDMGVRRCLMLGAYLADVVYSQPVVVTGYSSDPSLLERFETERRESSAYSRMRCRKRASKYFRYGRDFRITSVRRPIHEARWRCCARFPSIWRFLSTWKI